MIFLVGSMFDRAGRRAQARESCAIYLIGKMERIVGSWTRAKIDAFALVLGANARAARAKKKNDAQ